MKSQLRSWVGVVAMVLVWMAHAPVIAAADAAEAELIAAVTAVDDVRVAASVVPDRGRLEGVFSDDLRYAHSNGSIDTKASYIDSIVSGRSIYRKFEYAERNFAVISPDVVLMSGRALISAGSTDTPVALDLNFLAVWRLEHGVWRFVAWQSSRNAPPAPK